MARKYDKATTTQGIMQHLDTRSTFNELVLSDDGRITQVPLAPHSYSALEESLIKAGELKPFSLK